MSTTLKCGLKNGCPTTLKCGLKNMLYNIKHKKNGILTNTIFFYRLIMSPILMKFYTINDSFVSSIKLIEPKIQDNYGGKRPYIGVLLSINDLNYFAPLSSYKSKQDRINNITVFKLHEKGNPENKLGVIHLNNMFPVPYNQLNEVIIDINDSYGRMLQNQYEYILHYQEKNSKTSK